MTNKLTTKKEKSPDGANLGLEPTKELKEYKDKKFIISFNDLYDLVFNKDLDKFKSLQTLLNDEIEKRNFLFGYFNLELEKNKSKKEIYKLIEKISKCPIFFISPFYELLNKES